MPATPAAAADAVAADTFVPDLGGDAATAVNEAIDRAADQGGGIVHLTVGEHRLDAPVRLRSNVTLRGVSPLATVLVGGGIEHEPDVEGATVEGLTLDGGPVGIAYRGSAPDATGAAFCVVRDVRIRNTGGPGIELQEGAYHHLVFEALFIDDVGGDAFSLGASAPCRAVFLSQLAIGRFGTGAPGEQRDALRLAGRCQITQLRIDPVGTGQVGIEFLVGSERTVVSNLSIRTQGGTPFAGRDLVDVEIGTNEVESA